MLPQTKSITDRQAQILSVFKMFKSSYRKEALYDGWEAKRKFIGGKVDSTEVDALVESGHLKRNKNGATAITTKGKNSANESYKPV